VCIELQEFTDACMYAHHSRAGTLEQLKWISSIKDKCQGDPIKRDWFDLCQEHSTLSATRDIQEDDESGLRNQARSFDELHALQRKIVDLEVKIREVDATFFDSREPEIMPYQRMTECLGHNTRALIWQVSESWSGVFVIGSDLPEPRVLHYTNDDLKAIQFTTDALASALGEDNDLESFNSSLEVLSKCLWMDTLLKLLNHSHDKKNCLSDCPLEHQERKITFNSNESFHPHKYSHLVIISHDKLPSVPIESLPLSANDSQSESNTKTLNDIFTNGCYNIPSLQLWMQCRHQASKLAGRMPDRLLAIQNPNGDLHGAQAEIFAVMDEVNSNRSLHAVLEGQEATRENVLNLLKSEENIHTIHFACHGKHNETQRWLSYLALADESKFHVYDIVSLALSKVWMCVLSVCQSGLAGAKHEYVSLASGFLATGAPRVLASLWRVDDAATTLLFKFFYNELRSYPGISLSSALKNAQHRLRQVTFADVRTHFHDQPSVLERVRRRSEFKCVLATLTGNHEFWINPDADTVPESLQQELFGTLRSKTSFPVVTNVPYATTRADDPAKPRFKFNHWEEVIESRRNGTLKLLYCHLFPMDTGKTNRCFWIQVRLYTSAAISRVSCKHAKATIA
jgi:CHAT domain-containing protein